MRVGILFFTLVLAGCSEPQSTAPAPAEAQPEAPAATPAEPSQPPAATLADVLAAQPEEVQARYAHRNPEQTLTFFGVEPGMTVVEALPGGGWYSNILLPWVGDEGGLIGANYSQELWPNFSFMTAERLEQLKTWTTDWPQGASENAGGASVTAFEFGSLPETMHGSADVVLFVRALHNMARFSDTQDFLGEAMTDAFNVLKPGGVVGIVQHHAREDMPDDWAGGANGYLKKSFIVERMTAAGFELVGESDVNANPKDEPTTDDFVWRLPPSYQGAGEDAEARAARDAIGESNRMTLKFRKPDTAAT